MEIVQAANLLSEKLGREVSAIKLFSHPSVSALSDYLADTKPSSDTRAKQNHSREKAKQRLKQKLNKRKSYE